MSGLRILVTGSRNWTDQSAVHDAMMAEARWRSPSGTRWSEMTLIHGAARGLDTIAAEIAAEIGMQIEPYPADWATFGKAAGHRRNAVMVASGADVCLAFADSWNSGTGGCARLARKAGIKTVDFGVSTRIEDRP